MKNSLKSLLYGGLMALPCGMFAQSFTETFGTIGPVTAIATASPGFVNASTLTYVGTADTRSTTPSTTVSSTGYASASGGANIFITSTVGKFIEIGNINTVGMTSPILSFGINKNVNLADGTSLAVETSTDGGSTWSSPLSWGTLPTGTGTSHWYFVTVASAMPSSSNLHIRWINTSTAVQFRIDDVTLTGSGTPTCGTSIAASGTVLCEGGVATLTASAAGASTFAWYNTTSTVVAATTQTINVTQSGTYSVVVTNSVGCISHAGPIQILVNPTPTISVSSNPTLVCAGSCATLTARALAPDLYYSAYVEGQSNEKYLQVYNNTGHSVNLSDYAYVAYHNGSDTATFVDTLSGTLNDGDIVVLANPNAFSYTGTTEVVPDLDFNGNDAVALFNLTTHQNADIIGSIGHDPVSNWNNGGSVSTLDMTLVRKGNVYSGVTTNPDLAGQQGYTAIDQWVPFPVNTVSVLASYSADVTYSFSAGTPIGDNQSQVCPEVATVYTVTATDFFSGCSSTATVQVNVATPPTVNIDNGGVSSASSCFQPSVNLNAVPAGGAGSYTYLWSEAAQTTQSITVAPTAPTDYTVVVTDANGCTAAATITVGFIDACCGAPSFTNVLVCTAEGTACVDPATAHTLVDGGDATVGPCDGGGRKMSPAAQSAMNNAPVMTAYPNPFVDNASFDIQLAQTSKVKIEIFDYTGKKVAEVNNSTLTAGTHTFSWNGNNTAGNNVASGLYLARITSGDSVQTLKIQKLAK